jgi:hypothetical protein
VPTGRLAGVDANVSNLSLASFPYQQPDELVIEQITLTEEQQQAAKRAARAARARQRALERSRRNSNPERYGLSARQVARAHRRAERGLPPRRVNNPGDARAARADGTPLRAYRRDTVSHAYQRTRADHAADARARSFAKQARAREIAAVIVATHGNAITIEQCVISTWAKLWGKGIQVFSPGMLVAALAAECRLTGGRLRRAGTHSTALSQHCLCGQRVPRLWRSAPTTARPVDCAPIAMSYPRHWQRVDLADPDDANTAPIDYELARAVGVGWPRSKRRGLSQSAPATGSIVLQGWPGPAATKSWPLLSDATTIRPTPEQTSTVGRHGSSRIPSRPNGLGGSMTN